MGSLVIKTDWREKFFFVGVGEEKERPFLRQRVFSNT